jgi:hypothetical protein
MEDCPADDANQLAEDFLSIPESIETNPLIRSAIDALIERHSTRP